MMTQWKPTWEIVKTLSHKEWLESLRNRWIQIFIALFFGLSSFIIFIGSQNPSGVGFESFNRTTASLLNLVIFLVPVLTLLLGSMSLSGEKEQGTLNLLLSKPINGTELILGKYFGLAAAVVLSILLGFGLTGTFLAFQVSVQDARTFFVILFLSMILSLAFLSLSILISVWAERRMSAVISAVLVWFVMIILYDFLLMGAAAWLQGKALLYFLLFAILLNPADSLRIYAIMQMDGQSVFGPAVVELSRLLNQQSIEVLLLFTILLWMIFPMIAAIYLFNRRRLKG